MNKLLYVSNSTYPSLKANSVQVIKMCEEFGEHFDTTLTGFSSSGEYVDIYKQFDVKDSFKISLYKPGKNILYVIKLLFFILFKKYDIYYSRNFLFAAIMSFFSKKVVFECHIDPKDHPSYAKILHPFLKFTNLRIISISGKLKELIIERLNYHKKKDFILVAHDAADDSKFDFEYSNIEEKDKIDVGYIGSLYKGRGLNIVSGLAKLNPSINFNVVGGSEKEIEELKKEYPFENLNFKGHVPYSDVPYYMSQQDIFLAPYQSKLNIAGFKINTVSYMSPLKVFEYMASRRPIIISKLEIFNEVMNSKSAYFADPDDINEWNKALNELVSNPLLYRDTAKRAYELFINEYTVKTRVRNISKFVNS